MDGFCQNKKLMNREGDNRSSFCQIRIAEINKYQQINKH